ncbi:hypothetical protein RJD24_16665 [Bacillaceae bacterium IKA-2]|nr:hypothetical protein RJD24_16665 [Bacillaceae bacterium IKA-2]
MRWFLLSLASISCIAVWAFVIITVFSGDEVILTIEEQTVESQIVSEIVVEDRLTTESAEVVREEAKKEVIYGNKIMKERGIHKGDFLDIAPNGEISIDELLYFVEKDQH